MKPSNPAAKTGLDEPLKANFLDGLADALELQGARRRSFKETVREAAREFQAGRASSKVDVIRREITSLAKAVAKVLNKPKQKKREALRWRLNHLSPEAINYLLRHSPPHDRSNPLWESNELTQGELEDLYARCCFSSRTKDKNGNLLSKPVVKFGPVKNPRPSKKPGRPEVAARPLDYPKRALYAHLGLAFYEGTGTYPKRRDIVFMTDHVLNQLGEPPKHTQGGSDTDLARDYLRLLKESRDIVVSSRANVARRKKARERLTRMREKLLPVLEAELVGKKCIRIGQDWCEATAVTYELSTNAFYVHYRLGTEVLPHSFTRAAIEKLYG